MQLNVQNPNIAAGFQALASAFLPNSQALIEADLARYKREGMIADTNRTNVDATRLAADRERLLTEAARKRAFIEADQNIASILSDPAFDPANPAWRARLAGAAAMTENGMQNAPAGITGLTSFIDPNFAGSPDNFANVLMGTGVVNNYANTQPGFQANEAGEMSRNAADNVRALDVARIQAAAEMDRLKYATTTPLAPGAKGAGGGASVTPLTIQPDTAAKFAEAIAGQIEQRFPGAVVDPALAQALTSEALTLFQQSRNADAAIAQVLSGLTSTTTDESWWPTGDTTRVQRPGGMGQPPAQMTAPASAPAAAAPAPSATVPTQPPAAAPVTIIDGNGRRMMLDPATMQWVPVGPVR